MGVAGCLKENSHFYYCFVIDIFNNKTIEGNNFWLTLVWMPASWLLLFVHVKYVFVKSPCESMAKLWKQTELLHLKENVPPLTKFIGYVNFTDCLKILSKDSQGGAKECNSLPLHLKAKDSFTEF